MASEVEETLKRLVSHKGVIGTIVVNNEGVRIISIQFYKKENNKTLKEEGESNQHFILHYLGSGFGSGFGGYSVFGGTGESGDFSTNCHLFVVCLQLSAIYCFSTMYYPDTWRI